MRVLKAEEVGKVLLKGGPARVDAEVPAKFRAGDEVVTRNINPTGHTRLPRYARGRRGVIDRHHGVFIFADAHAAGKGKSPQNLYSVKFSARELWGAQGSESNSIYMDLWDDHLDPA
jgi:nitrile hydratase